MLRRQGRSSKHGDRGRPIRSDRDGWLAGRSGARPERGIATSGMIGEVFKSGADPQHNTACQRVWLPSSSLVLDPAKRAPVPVDDVKPTTANCMQYM